MKTGRKKTMEPMIAATAILGILFAASAVLIALKATAMKTKGTVWGQERTLPQPAAHNPAGPAPEIRGYVSGLESDGRSLFASELRVAAIGSAYPIPFDAQVCPFSSVPQPAINQLDRDGDGMTDDWEMEHGLDKHNPLDALGDLDGDGFTNLEEFRYGTDPRDASSHPPYALKLRFVARKDVPFPLVFQGASTLPDGRTVFQINTPADGRTYFLAVGEVLEDIVLQQFIPRDGEGMDRLVVRRGSTEITLPRGERVADPESQAELINILDHHREVVTMSTLLSLRNDEYTVLGVYDDRVVVRRLGTGEVFDIVGLVEEEQEQEMLLRKSE